MKASGCSTMNHSPCCEPTIFSRSSDPERITTPMSANDTAISYEMSCADERRPPSREYLLFDANPPSKSEYTPSDGIPRMKSSPTLTWAMSQWNSCPNQLLVPQGITA